MSTEAETTEFVKEIDLAEYARRGEVIPHAESYRVRIDGDTFRIDTDRPTAEALLSLVGKRPCAFELIEEFVDHENDVIDPHETVNLHKPGLKGFITAHKEIVTIFIKGDPYEIQRGERTIVDILSKVGETPEGYILLEEKDGPPMPLPDNKPVKIHGCEVFHTQVNKGGSS